MTLEEIDRALSSWNQRLAAIADNLLELQSDPTYRVLAGADGATPVLLTGDSAKRVTPALKAIETIFHQFSLLQAAIDRAAQLRKELRPVFGRDQTLREVEAMLTGASIQLPADALSLRERTLLSGAQGTLAMKPEHLLASMAKAFTEARDAVLLVSGTWDELAHEVNAAETRMRQLQGAAESGEVRRALGEAEKALGAIKEQVQSDPLAARELLRSELLPSLAEAAREVELRSRVQQLLVEAHAMLERLRELESGICAAMATRREKISGNGVPLPAAQPTPSEALSAWLERLKARCGDETAETIARGLENWRTAMNKATEDGVHALQQERAPLEMRSELRGRLDALKAKARVYGVAEDAALAGLARQAEGLLYTKPTDLTRSAAAVEAYERGLAVPGASRRRTLGSSEERR
jgi:hypothetical protein